MQIEELRARLMEKMERFEITQMAVAKCSGVAQPTLSLFLRGAGLSVDNYNKLVEYVRA